MTRITLDTDEKYLICEVVADDGRRLAVQTDWDAPGIASTFGWSVQKVQRIDGTQPCSHVGTDGTVDCKQCGVTASDFISSAIDFINDHDGKSVDDPGYFDG